MRKREVIEPRYIDMEVPLCYEKYDRDTAVRRRYGRRLEENS
jgi:hypothetical protein